MKRVFIAIAAFAAAVAFADDRIAIESFFKIPQYAQMRLSPDGKHIAALAPLNEKQGLVVIDMKTRTATPIAGRSDRDIVNVSWINNKRVLYTTGRLAERDFDQRGGGLFAVDIDGSAERLISEGSDERGSAGWGRNTFRPLAVVRTLPGDSDDIIVHENIFAAGAVRPQPGALYRMDTRTGRKTALSDGKPEAGDAESWVVDRNGVPRVFRVDAPDETVHIFYREGADAPWRKIGDFKLFAPEAFRPLAMAEDGRTLYVSSRKGGDKLAIYRFDPNGGTIGELVAAHPQIDVQTLAGDKERVRGVRYNADIEGSAWFDEDLARAQSIADKTLPGAVNVLSWSLDRSLVLITSFSDVSPPSFYLFDMKARKMESLADSRPWIDPKRMSPMQPVHYKARDGLDIPAYLTVPRGSSGKNMPMVVVVHGGPWVDGDSWGWNPEAQFLASRGYVVLQPNYRGTTRYGWKHFSSSFKQWGREMQDDVTDGVNWAVSQGIADPKRVCIYGGSYGGYATLMGLIKDPDLYQCGIDYVGVADLPLMYTAVWSDISNSDFAMYSYKVRVGDIDKELDKIKAVSPVELASRIKAPLLMAYGTSDIRVVPQHGTRMKDALERAGAKPEWMLVTGEGHGFRDLENQKMFYGAMEKFLDKYIGEKRN
jgi:dipeptidyl aminopeptidase/acylaminoacyl peptidase